MCRLPASALFATPFFNMGQQFPPLPIGCHCLWTNPLAPTPRHCIKPPSITLYCFAYFQTVCVFRSCFIRCLWSYNLIAIYKYDHHGLRASASFVLMATGFVNGRWQFSTPTESTPFDRSPKNLVQVIMSAAPIAVTNLVQIRTRGASGQMGEI